MSKYPKFNWVKGSAWVVKDNKRISLNSNTRTEFDRLSLSISALGSGSVFVMMLIQKANHFFSPINDGIPYPITLYAFHCWNLMRFTNDNAHFNWIAYEKPTSSKIKGLAIFSGKIGHHRHIFVLTLDASHVKRWSIPLSCYCFRSMIVPLSTMSVSSVSDRTYTQFQEREKTKPSVDYDLRIQTEFFFFNKKVKKYFAWCNDDLWPFQKVRSIFERTKKVFFFSVTQDVYQNISFLCVSYFALWVHLMSDAEKKWTKKSAIQCLIKHFRIVYWTIQYIIRL